MQFLKTALEGLLLRAQLRCGDVCDWFRETERTPDLVAIGAGVLTGVMPLEQRRVLSAAPVVATPLPVKEGDIAVLEFTFTDTDSTGTFKIEIDWDQDGKFDVAKDLDTSGDSSNTHTFSIAAPFSTSDDGSFPITIRVTDSETNATTLDTNFVVENVEPTIDAASIQLPPISTGSVASLTFQFTDPGLADFDPANATAAGPMLEVDWNGDGNFEYVLSGDAFFDSLTSLSAGRYELSVKSSSTFDTATAGTPLNVSIRLTDNAGDPGTATAQFEVNEIIGNPGPVSIGEGSNAALSFDVTTPGTDPVMVFIDWDNGSGFQDVTPQSSTGTFPVTVESPDAYPDQGTFDLRVMVTDGSMNVLSTRIVELTVNNMAPVIGTVSLPSITQGNLASLTLQFTDPGLDDFKSANATTAGPLLEVDWNGDGTIDDTYSGGAFFNNLTDLGGGRYELNVKSSAPFNDVASYSALIRVRDNSGAPSDNPADANDDVTAPLQVTSLLTNVTAPDIFEGDHAMLTFDVAVPDGGSVQVFVDWADGSSGEVNVTPTGPQSGTLSFPLTSPAAYRDDGSRTLQIRIANSDDTVTIVTQSVSLTVNNVAPMIDTVSLPAITQGNHATLTLQFTDPGLDDFKSANATSAGPMLEVDWNGDGTIDDTYSGDAFFNNLTDLVDGQHSITVVSTMTFPDKTPPRKPIDVAVHITDNSGAASATATGELVVLDLLNVDAVQPINEGSKAMLSFTVTPPKNETVTVTVDWADGNQPQEVMPTSSMGKVLNFEGLISPNYYQNDGLIKLKIEVTDSGGGTYSTEVMLTVNNVAPVIDTNQIMLPSITQGNQATLTLQFTDPGLGDFNSANATTDGPMLVVDWKGDGTVVDTYSGDAFFNPLIHLSSEENGATITERYSITVKSSAPFNDVASYTAVIHLFDNSGASSNAPQDVNLQVNSLLTNVRAPDIIEGDNAMLSFDVAVPDGGAVLVFVDWGDGKGEMPVMPPPEQDGILPFAPMSPEKYANPGPELFTNYTLQIRITNSDGTVTYVGRQEVTLTVKNNAPVIDSVSLPPITQFDYASLTLQFTDPGLDDFKSANATTAGPLLVVDWKGDGTVVDTYSGDAFFHNLTDLGGGRYELNVKSSALFRDVASYTALIRVRDNSGAVSNAGTAQLQVDSLVKNIDAPAIFEGMAASLQFDVTVPQIATGVTVFVDWGDGKGEMPVTPQNGTLHFELTSPIAYQNSGPLAVTEQRLSIRVANSDDTVTFVTQNVSLTVNNVAPVINTVSLPSITQGNLASLTLQFTDPGLGDFKSANATTAGPLLVVDWKGDGTVADTYSGNAFFASLTDISRVENGVTITEYSITVKSSAPFNFVGSYAPVIHLFDNSGAPSDAPQDVNLQVTSLLTNVSAGDVNEGQKGQLDFVVIAPLAQQISVLTDWGDGNGLVSQVTPSFGDTAHYPLMSPSVYPDNRAVMLRVLVTTADGRVTFADQMIPVNVMNVAPSINAGDVSATEIDPKAASTTLTVIFKDPGLVDFVEGRAVSRNDNSAAWDFDVHWGDAGDGHIQSPALISRSPDGSQWQLTVTYQYGASAARNMTGEFTIDVTIRDKDGGISNTVTTTAKAPQGILFPSVAQNFAPPSLNLLFPPVSTPVTEVASVASPLVVQSIQSSTPPALNSSETRVAIFVVRDGKELEINVDRDDANAEAGRPEWSMAGLDEILARLQGMPANQYRVYLIQDNVRRLIVDVVIREGRVQEAQEVDPLDAVLQRMEQSLSEQSDAGPPEAPKTTNSNPAADAVPQEAGAGGTP